MSRREPFSSVPGLIFLALLLVYDVVMVVHAHYYHGDLGFTLDRYTPVHPALPLFGRPEPILRMAHVRWLLLAHGVGSAFPLVAILAQLAGPVRRRFRSLHRLNGRAVVLSSLAFAALPGVFLAGDVGRASAPLRVLIGGLAVLLSVAAVQTWRNARRGEIRAHARWGLRLATYLHVIPGGRSRRGRRLSADLVGRANGSFWVANRSSPTSAMRPSPRDGTAETESAALTAADNETPQRQTHPCVPALRADTHGCPTGAALRG